MLFTGPHFNIKYTVPYPVIGKGLFCHLRGEFMFHADSRILCINLSWLTLTLCRQINFTLDVLHKDYI